MSVTMINSHRDLWKNVILYHTLYVSFCTIQTMDKRGTTFELAQLTSDSTDVAPLDPEHLGAMAEDAVRALVTEGES